LSIHAPPNTGAPGTPPFVGRIAPVSGADAVKLARSGTRVELPHRSEAQRALGHDLRGVDAYVGAAAEQACCHEQSPEDPHRPLQRK
jgi:hypothetical protein